MAGSARDKLMETSFDYVVVGGGTSGCVAAAKLVATYNAKVLLLEAGPEDGHPLLRMPAGFIKMLKGSKYLNFRESIPQSQLFGRTQIVPQAKVLGGGSTVNAQVYMRGRAADWDAWRTLTGSDLWSWEAILRILSPRKATRNSTTNFTERTGQCSSPTPAISAK